MESDQIIVKENDWKVSVGRVITPKDPKKDPYFIKDRELFKVRPMTQQEKEYTIKRRGREGFSYGKSVCILPSARFYKPLECERIYKLASEEYEREDTDD